VPKQNFLGLYNSWAAKHNQHGRHAFQRFVMLTFLEAIEEISSDFVFKGGNLLWHYIKTPRQTVDLDFSTLTINSHSEVSAILEKTTNFYEDITFKVKKFVEINRDDGRGAAVVISYKAINGQENQFPVDIVYALPTDLMKVKSTLSSREYQSASIENIISDKVAAAHRFISGNTRMKDFDDILRIKQSKISVNKNKLKKLISSREVPLELDPNWISEDMKKSWKGHIKDHKDLPVEIGDLFIEINEWLKTLRE